MDSQHTMHTERSLTFVLRHSIWQLQTLCARSVVYFQHYSLEWYSEGEAPACCQFQRAEGRRYLWLEIAIQVVLLHYDKSLI